MFSLGLILIKISFFNLGYKNLLLFFLIVSIFFIEFDNDKFFKNSFYSTFINDNLFLLFKLFF